LGNILGVLVCRDRLCQHKILESSLMNNLKKPSIVDSFEVLISTILE